MINARSRLLRGLREFVDSRLCGLVVWDRDVRLMPPIEADRIGHRRNPEGKFKEIAGIVFGDYEILVSSPNEAGPVGTVTLRYLRSPVILGPLDQATWDKIAPFICEKGMRQDNGDRKHQSPGSADEWQPAY